MNGDYENGWHGYEHPLAAETAEAETKRNFVQPMPRDLLELKGRRILLHAEQGFGDAIQFCRYAAMANEAGAEVILECPPPLARLFATLSGVTTIIPRGETLPEFDLQCPLMSLPRLFGTTLATVPAKFRIYIPHI